jgi:hypothetical protein
MWESTLLKFLAKKLCPKDPGGASQFVRNLCSVVHKQIYNQQSIQPIVLLGVIKDLFMMYSTKPRQTLSLVEFCEYCFGLFMLHIKNAEEEQNIESCYHFSSILTNKYLSSYLNVQEKIELLTNDYAAGILKSKREYDVEYGNFKDFIRPEVLKTIIWDIESKAFKHLNYCVSVPFDEVVVVLNVLFNRIDKPHHVLFELYNSLLPYKNEGDFKYLIPVIEKNLPWVKPYKTEALDNLSSVYRYARGFFLDIPAINKLVYGSGKPSGPVEIELIGWISYPNQLDPSAHITYQQLKEYLSAPSYSFFSCCRAIRKYKAEVADVIEQIEDGLLNDIDSIVVQLEQIDINDKDLLGPILSCASKIRSCNRIPLDDAPTLKRQELTH